MLVPSSFKELSVKVFAKVVVNRLNFSLAVFIKLFPDFKGRILLLLSLINFLITNQRLESAGCIEVSIFDTILF